MTIQATRAIVVPDDDKRARIPKRTRTDRGKRAAGSIAFHAVSIALLIVLLYPAAWMVLSAFKPSGDIIGNVSLIPETWTLENFTQVLEGIAGMSFWRFAWNSLVLAVLTVVGVCLSSSVTAYAFARIDFRGRGIWFALMIGTLLLPFHVVIIPQYIVFNQLNMINTFTPLLIGRFLATEAFFVFLLVQFMRSVPRDLDEAARIDGAGHVRIFTTIMLPLMRPALVTCSIFAFLNSWNDFFGPLLYLKSPDLYPLPIALRLYIDSTSASNFGAQMAMAVLSLLPVLLFFLIFQRYIVGGIATSGLKG
ncbi:sugar ABC transporter permease [Microbacterium nanhaiense]|uniref:Sugar ABC transporter permease n=1 Tax=Microbacterium nanhaiense TaxID=1301026 RepID=A0ABQ2N0N3_9MICO|nr:carbohydrate ABC transporter permease [Microbacterium nanhaiense]GGO64031.1 sugar ABC transporter permease [Microbacterium nanhaiense]